MATLRVPLRHSAVALWFSGAAWAVTTPLHPTIFQGDVARVILRTAGWEAIHVLVMTGLVAAILGVAGIAAAHHGQLGRRGDLVLAVTVAGAVVMAAVMFAEAFVLPTLAEHDAALVELDGPLLGRVAVRIAVAAAGAYPIGLALLGLLAAGSDLAPRAGWALFVSTIGFVALGGLFVPVLGVLATWAFAAAHGWWGWVLWQHQGDAQPARGAPIGSAS